MVAYRDERRETVLTSAERRGWPKLGRLLPRGGERPWRTLVSVAQPSVLRGLLGDLKKEMCC